DRVPHFLLDTGENFLYVVCVQLNGKNISAKLITQINETIASQPDMSRRQLSHLVCEWLDWRSPNGTFKEVSCRVALLKLHQQGQIELPAPKPHPNLKRSSSPKDDISFPEPTAVQCTFQQLGEISLVRIKPGNRDQSRRWNAMMQRYHYLGAGPLCGAQIRYFIESEQYGTLGGLAFSAAALRVSARDRWISWDNNCRQQRLSRIVNNSRFLILPTVKVKNLASHVLSLAAKQLTIDWLAQYAIAPVLLETFVEQGRFSGTCYKAANWTCVGQTKGRGRQDKNNQYSLPVKDIYIYPLHKNARAILSAGTVRRKRTVDTSADWAEEEFGSAQFGDKRRVNRLLTIARDFYARPQANIPQACRTRAKTKATYRFMNDKQHTLDTILAPHYEATLRRCEQEKIVLAVQDTSSLNYSTHPETENLGPISTQPNGVIGLLLHDTMAFNNDGTPLGLLDVQCWARDPDDFGKKHRRHQLPIEKKESYKWLKSYQAVAVLQAKCPDTMFVSVGDREADIFELFNLVVDDPSGPQLLVRATHDRLLDENNGRLWKHVQEQAVSGVQEIQVPRQKKRKARVAQLEIRFARVHLKPPSGKNKLKPLTVCAILAQEINCPDDVKEPLQWMLLTTIKVTIFEQATQKLAWYAGRWGIEVYHRTLKSGCKIEERQLGSAERIEACLAIDMVVAWRIYYLTKLGREVPDVPCTVFFEDAEWKALMAYKTQHPIPPDNPPPLREAIRLLASLGGFLGRKGDGEPGTKSLWLGLQRLDDLAMMWKIMIPHIDPNNKSSPCVQYPRYG
ncbi:MAG: IS4 family transposase, partial [Candidatus Sabulitectum sp.]|nr:IS4 family transposase [Candidatus Sabulitectum sp.]